MAAEFIEQADVKRTSNGGYVALPENIVVKTHFSGRAESVDISDLIEDIKANGQRVPGTVCKSEDGWPILLAGHNRLRAIVEINKNLSPDSKIKFCFNYQRVKNDEEAFDVVVADNRNRTETNAIDDATNIATYEKYFKKSLEEISLKYFPGAKDDPEKQKKAIKWVTDRLSLLELSDEAQEELKNGRLATTTAIDLATLPRTQQDALVEAKKGAKKIKGSDVKELKAAKVRKIDPEIAVERAIKKNATSERIGELEELCEMGALLVAEVLSEFRNEVTLLDCSRELAALYAKAKISLPAELDKTYNR